jgi:hypothetical protein
LGFRLWRLRPEADKHQKEDLDLLRAGYDVCAVDEYPAAVASVREIAARLSPRPPASNFRAQPVEAMDLCRRLRGRRDQLRGPALRW